MTTLGTITTRTLDDYRNRGAILDAEIDALEQEVTTMTTYRERLKAGVHDAANAPQEPEELDPDNLPSRHAPLDQLATARGVVWQGDNPTVADKQAQLAAALEREAE